jgi:non-specific serine/threonine protein kinase
VREEPGRPILQTLREHIHDRRLLLVLDNCEHLLSEVAALAEALLRACPRLRILASSRESLNIAGETVFRVPSLTVPDPRSVAATPETLNRYESARLFLDRAAAAAPAFTVSPANAPAVAQICHRLDGIPLAIELAAARVKVLPVEQIAARLDDRFRLLTGGSRTALPRQQTLRALIDWSYDLLPPAERALFQRLSVFVGGWTLEAAEAVAPGAADGPPDLVESWEVLDLLASLVDKSLVVAEEPGTTNHPGVRYRLLETVRQYGRDRLLEGGDAAAVRDRHLDYFTRLAEDADAKIRGPEQGTWLARLETEHDNLRAALQWCKSAADTGLTGMRLASALARFWEIRGHFTEGREHLSGVLAREDAAAASPERARALRAGGILASGQGDAAAARARFEDSLAILRAAGDRQGVAQTLNNMGLLALRQGDAGLAQALCEESLAMWRELNDPNGLAATLNNFANAAVARGDYRSARAWYEEALHINRERGNRAGEAYNLNNLGDVAFRQGDTDAALDFYRRSLVLLRDLGDRHTIDALLDAFAAVAAAKGEWERSARLFGAADALREELGVTLSPADQEEHERQVAAARSALEETAFAAAWAVGRNLSPERATAFALGEDEA